VAVLQQVERPATWVGAAATAVVELAEVAAEVRALVMGAVAAVAVKMASAANVAAVRAE
jgi:hypothetical protein